MLKYKKGFAIFFALILVFVSYRSLTVQAVEPTAPPTINEIDPSTAVPDQNVEIYGNNLSIKITLVSSSGQTTDVTTGWVDTSLTIAGFQVPLDAQPDSYKIRVTNTKGIVTSTNSLLIKVGGAELPGQAQATPPTQGLPTNLGGLIQQIFAWSLGILGISLFVMFFYSGFLWLTAAGNTSKIGEARTHMTNAVFGAILLLSSYLILYTINPDFVKNTVNLPGLGPTTGNPTGSDGGGGGHCSDTGNHTNDYGGAVSVAMNVVISKNPNGIADKVNIEANQIEFLNYVADELKTNGYETTISVLNGNGFQNRGDLIAVWESGDSLMERFDSIIANGDGDRPLRNAATAQFTGDIPLDCVF